MGLDLLIAPDKFKGSATAPQVCNALISGLKEASLPCNIIGLPLADGGEGTAALLAQRLNAKEVTLQVQDPLGRNINASYFYAKATRTAIVEMAAASGLALLAPREQNPLFTSTYGTGQLIEHALGMGARKLLLGIGGSATHDAGTGMAAALGASFKDAKGKLLCPSGQNLGKIDAIDLNPVRTKLEGVDVQVACDVQNPLYGPEGAAFTYAAQKGADPAAIRALDEGMKHFAHLVVKKFNVDLQKLEGAGAAGGLGAGACLFLNGKLCKGFHLLAEASGLYEALGNCSVIISGEGCLDHTSLQGKVVGELIRLKKPHQKLVIVCGFSRLGPTDATGIDRIFALHEHPVSGPFDNEQVQKELKQTGRNIARWLHTQYPNGL